MFFLLHCLLPLVSFLVATSVILQNDLSQNAILKLCSFAASDDILPHLDELERVCEAFRKSHPPHEYLIEVNSLSRILFFSMLTAIVFQDSEFKARQVLHSLLDLQWKHLKTGLPDSSAFDLQRLAFAKGQAGLIKPIFEKSLDLQEKVNEWNKVHLPEYHYPNKLACRPVPECYINGAERFIQDWKNRPEVHQSYIAELFQIPDNIMDAIAFSTKQAQIQLDIMKRNLEMFRKAKSSSTLELEKRFRSAIKIQLIIGDYISVFHDLKKIRSLDGAKRADAIAELLVSLTWSLREGVSKLPKEIGHLLDKYEPFSIEWTYAKFRLMSFASAGYYEKVGTPYQRQLMFIQTQDSVSFLVMSKVILALKPFASKFFKAGFPYIVFDRASDEQYMANVNVGNCLKRELNFYRHCTRSRVQINAPRVTRFFEELLPEAFKKCQKLHSVTIYTPLPEADMKRLLTGCRRKTVRAVSSPASNEAVVKFDIVRDSDGSPTGAVPAEDPKDTEEVPPKKVLPNLVPELSDPNLKGPLDNVTPPTDAPFESLFKPHMVEIDYEEDLKDGWEEDYRSELLMYAQLKSLPESTHEGPTASNKRIKVVESPAKQASFVAIWSTNDFINLFPRANQVYYENVARNTALRSTLSKTMKFRWIFCPEVVIDAKTFRFLCNVFGLLAGKKGLTFSNFQRAFLSLISGPAAEPSKGNRTVFRFNHQFELDGQICVPPIGGVHPEHLSSRFNHSQVRKFLEHGGAHPYFFEEVWED